MVGALCALAIVALAAVRVVRRESSANPAPRAQPVVAVAAARPPEKPPALPDRGFLGRVVPSETVEVSSKIEGRVKKMNVRIGDHVARGAVLAVIDAGIMRRDLEMAEAQVLTAEADKRHADGELTLAKKKLERRTELSGASTSLPAVSGEELDNARSNADLAESTVDRAKHSVLEHGARVAQLKQMLAEAAIRAPFDGIVAARSAEVGTMVRAGSPVVRLNSTSLWVRFAVPEDKAERIQLGERMRVLPNKLMGAAASGEPAGGQEEKDKHPIIEVVVEKIAPEVDTASRMIFVEARVDAAAKSNSTAVANQEVRVFHAGSASAHLR